MGRALKGSNTGDNGMLEILIRQFHLRTEENHENSQSQYPVNRPRF